MCLSRTYLVLDMLRMCLTCPECAYLVLAQDASVGLFRRYVTRAQQFKKLAACGTPESPNFIQFS